MHGTLASFPYTVVERADPGSIMQWMNDESRYGAVAQVFHWIIVALIVTQFVLALRADPLPNGPAKLAVLFWHKSFGITILVLAVLRLVWRLINKVPAPPPEIANWQRLAARVSHVLMYALLVVIPLLGWSMSSARNFPVSWFGLFTLPDFVAPNRAAYEFLHEAHETAAKLLLVVALVHAAAALKHHFIDGNNVLRRMLPMQLKRQLRP
jgi:cytochrome b561